MNQAVLNFRNMLTEQGYRVTPQRLAIYEALVNSKEHPSAEELYSEVKVRYPMISPATVYNTLQLLVRLGLATELGFHGETRYDGNPDVHANILCLECQRIFDVDLDGLEELKESLAARSDFILLGERHEFFGICPDCRKKTRRPGERAAAPAPAPDGGRTSPVG